MPRSKQTPELATFSNGVPILHAQAYGRLCGNLCMYFWRMNIGASVYMCDDTYGVAFVMVNFTEPCPAALLHKLEEQPFFRMFTWEDDENAAPLSTLCIVFKASY